MNDQPTAALQPVLQSGSPAATPLSRRTVFAGVGGAAAALAAAAVLPAARGDLVAIAATPAADAKADGYQLTDHVRRYYQTARI